MCDAIDVARLVFVNRNKELRSGWRVVAFVALSYLSLLVIGSLIASIGSFVPSLGRMLIPPPDSEGASRHAVANFYINHASSLIAVLIATAVCAKNLEHRSFASVGLKLHRGFLRDFGLGLIVGAGSLGLGVLLEAITGAATFRASGRTYINLVLSLMLLFTMFFTAAAFEELFFRGFFFQALIHDLGPFPAVAITSTGFGLLHLANPAASLLSTCNTIVAGIWLSLAYLKTRSLWLPTGLHCAWNLAMVFVFGLPVSGLSAFTRIGLLQGTGSPPIWISGGAYGPEGGLTATVALVFSTLLVLKAPFFSTTKEMTEAIKHGKQEPTFLSIINPE
ncbi:MAG TPA: CPBP family intramembrane glutamic endopeptidase [Blastocatellia bacterium]|nr:CPBP family intramembrane glutamic endopeptidase [Blastocatellia bacterium]